MIISESIHNGILIKNIVSEPSDLSTAEQKYEWQSACNSCEFKLDNYCNYCGCFLQVLMTYKNAKCPMGKW